MSKITVIIPTYNRAGTIRRALDSVIEQSQPPDEIIVVDDGSTDETGAVIQKEYPTVKYLFQENYGVSSARNNGMMNACGDWLAFLDSDDEWLPGKLARQMDALAAHNRQHASNLDVDDSSPDMRVCHTNEIWIRNGKYLNQKRKHQKFGGYIYEKCLPLCVISPSSVIIHRSVFEDIGMFDENMPACEDYDMWLRICSKMPVLFIDEPLIHKYGGHDDQLSHVIWGLDRYRIYALEKMLKYGNLEGKEYDLTRAMLIEKTQIVIQGAEKRDNDKLASEYQEMLKKYRS